MFQFNQLNLYYFWSKLIILITISSCPSAILTDYNSQYLSTTTKYPNKYNTNNYPSTIHYNPSPTAYINDIRRHIQEALMLEEKNKTLKVQNIYSVDLADPIYVFVLPGERNQTLVLRKSNFGEAIYPNVTALKRLRQLENRTAGLGDFSSEFNNNFWTNNRQSHALQLKLNDFKMPTNDLDEAESMKIVAENVRTERNFLKFMEQLNRDRDSNELNVNSEKLISEPLKGKLNHFHIEYQTTARSTEVDWDDLGLTGWAGGLRKPGSDFKPTERGLNLYNYGQYFTTNSIPSTSKNKKSNYRKGRAKKLKTTTQSISSFKYSTNPTKPSTTTPPTTTTTNGNLDVWEVDMKIPNELNKLLQKDVFGSVAGKNNRTKWSITTSRAEHKDDDVFIARANNPFGHSTKWKLRNDSNTATSSTTVNSNASNENRPKRDALKLYSMVKCSTGCDPLIYKGYGCYCGFLGSGRTLDGIDRCCKMHDYCYEVANCTKYLEYFVPYLWKCYRGHPLCAIDHGEWGGPGSCAARLCECDQALSKCLRRFYCPRKRAVCTSSPWRLLQNIVMEI